MKRDDEDTSKETPSAKGVGDVLRTGIEAAELAADLGAAVAQLIGIDDEEPRPSGLARVRRVEQALLLLCKRDVARARELVQLRAEHEALKLRLAVIVSTANQEAARQIEDVARLRKQLDELEPRTVRDEG